MGIKYTKENAPKSIKIDMDYMSSPVWVSDLNLINDDTPRIHMGLELFPFPSDLKHILYCYQEAWEAANSSKFIKLDNNKDNTVMSNAIESSLSTLKGACEDMLDKWLKDNDWDTKLYR